MRAPSSTNEECINPGCSLGKPQSSSESRNERMTSTINEDTSFLEMSGDELNTFMETSMVPVEAVAVNGKKSYPPKSISDTPGYLLEKSIAKIQVGMNISGFNRFDKANEPSTELQQESDESNNSTATENQTIGNTETIESKLKAQIEMAEFLGSLF